MCVSAHFDFEGFDLFGSEGVCLGNDWNDVDEMVKLLHELYIQGLQSVCVCVCVCVCVSRKEIP